jgi:hypothetical protein
MRTNFHLKATCDCPDKSIKGGRFPSWRVGQLSGNLGAVGWVSNPAIGSNILFLGDFMSQMIESMESRILFHASVAVIKQDLAILTAAGAAAKADLKAALAVATADVKTIKADFVATRPTSTQRKVLQTVQKDVQTASGKYRRTINAILGAGTRSGAHLESLLLNLKAHPTSLVIQTKVNLTLATLQGIFSSEVVTMVETSAGAAVASLDTDLDAVVATVPSTQTDVTTTESHFATDLLTLSNQATAIQSDIATLAADLA